MENNRKFAIDLLWLRVGKVGGSESFIRNLISGFRDIKDDYRIYLILAKDNYDSFAEYKDDERFKLIRCPVDSCDVKQRIIYQNFKLSEILTKNNINKCLEPIYSIPLIGTKKIQYYSVIHDLQALHFPENFSRIKQLYLKYAWKHSIRSSKKIVVISDFTKKDLTEHFKLDLCKVRRIYLPIKISNCDEAHSKEILKRYGLESGKFFFCVTSLLPHKNIEVLLDIIQQQNAYKLVICGVGGRLKEGFISKIHEMGLSERIIVAPYVDDEVRNVFYCECKLFLFPSIFEGFGMPLVEAMMLGKNVVTTRCASIPEVTLDRAFYVDDAKDAFEWTQIIKQVISEYACVDEDTIRILKERYDSKSVAMQYMEMLFCDENRY